jgi:hypothetical protein
MHISTCPCRVPVTLFGCKKRVFLDEGCETGLTLLLLAPMRHTVDSVDSFGQIVIQIVDYDGNAAVVLKVINMVKIGFGTV